MKNYLFFQVTLTELLEMLNIYWVLLKVTFFIPFGVLYTALK